MTINKELKMNNRESKYYAFFDVDGTLMEGKPMVDFLRFYYRERFSNVKVLGELIFRLRVCKLKIYQSLGRNREFLNKEYYKSYKNKNVNWMKEVGERWFSLMVNKTNYYINSTIDELIKHQNNGAEIVFVSGSFFACLDSFARKFGVRHVLSTSLEVNDNRLTGKIFPPQMIGLGKAEAIRRFLKQHSFSDYHRCYAYGDHISDIPMLSLVGHPVVISGDTLLEEHARKNDWKIIN